MKQKKTHLLLITFIVLINIISSCASSGTNNSKSSYTTWSESTEDTSLETIVETNIELSSTTESEEDNYVTETYALDKLRSGYSEGLAWANIRDIYGNLKIAVINQNAEIIYMFDAPDNYTSIVTTPFTNGKSVVYTQSNQTSQGFYIVDSNGDVVYSNDELYMCGAGEYGDYLVTRHESGFAGDIWYVHILDSDFNLSEPLESQVEKDIIYCDEDDVVECQPGVFLIRTLYCEVYNYVYDYASIIYMSHDCEAFLPEYLYWSEFSYVSHEISAYLVPYTLIANIRSEEEIGNIRENSEVNRISIIPEDTGNPYFPPEPEVPTGVWENTSIPTFYYERLVNGEYWSYDVIDADSNVIFTYPQLPEGAKYFHYVAPYDGKYVVYMVGADGVGYTTLFDENGNMAYEPVEIPIFGQYSLPSIAESKLTAFAGYSITSEEIIVSPSGKLVNIGDDLTGMDTGESFSFESYDLKLYISEGYIYYDNIRYKTLMSLDGKKEINMLTATYDNNGRLVFG